MRPVDREEREGAVGVERARRDEVCMYVCNFSLSFSVFPGLSLKKNRLDLQGARLLGRPPARYEGKDLRS